MLTATAQTNFTTLQGVALKGRMVQARNDERFVSGTIKGDNMVLVFISRYRVQVSPRKWAHKTTYRQITCRRKFSPSHADFWWEGVRQHYTTIDA